MTCKRLVAVALVLAPLALGGCMLDDSNMKPALFELPKKQRVLVWVDPRPSAGMPIDAPQALGKAIANDLYTFKAADDFVAQTRMTDVRRDKRYEQFGIADMAHLVDADVVIYVDTLSFHIESLSAGQLTQGSAEATVKVVDKTGKRLFPPTLSALGFPVQAHVDVAVTEEQSEADVKSKLIADITEQVGHIFHRWDAGGDKMDHSQPVVE